MGKWLPRGLAFAALMIVVRVVQGTLINQFETHAAAISVALCALLVVVALLWGWIDGRTDARTNPDPDRRDDLAMAWLLAGLAAGLLSGIVSWAIAMVYKPLYTAGLISELTTFAAFTALMVFLPAVLGVAIGRWLTDRHTPEVTRHSLGQDGSADVDRADTDVFAAVRAEPAAEAPTISNT